MPSYEIEQYELHSQNYLVETNNEAEAIKLVLEGEADAVNYGLEYIEVCEERGLIVDQHKELASALRLVGVDIDHEYIPSIRSVKKLA